MKRYGSVLGLKEECIDEYKALHAAVWPEILATIAECNMKNYSIHLKKMDDGKYYLFSYFEYVGDNFESDMAKMAADEATQRWWAVCEPMQEPLQSRQEGEWWSLMEEVFHCD